MERSNVVQSVLNLFTDPAYLEIGVSKGVTFHKIRAKTKVAVDPKFDFDLESAKRENVNSKYYQITSDEYFGSAAEPKSLFDVIYLDGLHTAEQTLRDFLNAILFLKADGVIVIDDVKPRNHLASIPDRVVFNEVRRALGLTNQKTWMGDVYKVIFFLSTFVQQFEYRTVTDNHGQSIAWRRARRNVPEQTIEAVGAKTFDEFIVERAVLKEDSLNNIIREIQNRQ